MIKVSAPGKLMLLGEHAVVYGFASLVTAVDERLTVEAEHIPEDRIVVEASQGNDTRFVDEAVRQAGRSWNLPRGVAIKTQSNFSGKYGFGSSAAVTVATLKALAAVFQKHATPRELFDLSYKTILAVQGVGSGFDVAAAVYGGTLYFVGGGTVIEPVSFSDMPLIIGYTGVKSNTVDLIRKVAQKREQYPVKIDQIFQAITKLVDEAKTRMIEGDWERVGKLMDFNQEYLRDIGVSSHKLETLISAAKKAGAWGAKLSGAGGGDCMVALHPDGVQGKLAITRAIHEAGGEVVDVRASAEGVRIES